MAKPHKYAGAAVRITTTLPEDRLAALAKAAADGAATGVNRLRQVRLEEVQPGRLTFSVRDRATGQFEHLVFVVRLQAQDGVNQLATKITRYKMHRRWIFVVPLPRRMEGWYCYRDFMTGFGAAVRKADPQAKVRIVGAT